MMTYWMGFIREYINQSEKVIGCIHVMFDLGMHLSIIAEPRPRLE